MWCSRLAFPHLVLVSLACLLLFYCPSIVWADLSLKFRAGKCGRWASVTAVYVLTRIYHYGITPARKSQAVWLLSLADKPCISVSGVYIFAAYFFPCDLAC